MENINYDEILDKSIKEVSENFTGIGLGKNPDGTPIVPSDFIIKKLVQSPEIKEQMAMYVQAFGKKPDKNLAVLIGQVGAIDQTLKNNFKALHKANFIGRPEHFDASLSQPSYLLDRADFIRSEEMKRGIEPEHFQPAEHFEECFDASSLVDKGVSATPYGSAIKGASDLLSGLVPADKNGLRDGGDEYQKTAYDQIVKELGLATAGNLKRSMAMMKNAQNVISRANDLRAQAEAIKNGVPLPQGRLTQDQAQAGVSAIKTVGGKILPAKVTGALGDIFNEFKDQETQSTINKNMPLIIGVLVGVVIITILVVRK
jgi:hypothetical protein